MQSQLHNIPTVPSCLHEQNLLNQGYNWVIGLDEVGRGSLAGPVMVGAAIIGQSQIEAKTMPEGLADSKLLTEHRRQALYEPLQSWCSAWAVGSCTNKEIDEWGISYALGVAALKAIASAQEQLAKRYANNPIAEQRFAAILDGPCDYIDNVANTFDAPDVPFAVKVNTLVKADRQCASVAAAAVLAKVTRDELMVSLANKPEYAPYDWAHNKGYGSLAHRNAIKENGPSDLHRLSWHL